MKEYSGDDKEIEKDVIECFLKDIPLQLNKFEEYIRSNKFEDIRKVAHKIKSSVAYFGLNKVYNLLTEIEKSTNSHDNKMIIKVYLIVKKFLNDNINELRQLLFQY